MQKPVHNCTSKRSTKGKYFTVYIVSNLTSNVRLRTVRTATGRARLADPVRGLMRYVSIHIYFFFLALTKLPDNSGGRDWPALTGKRSTSVLRINPCKENLGTRPIACRRQFVVVVFLLLRARFCCCCCCYCCVWFNSFFHPSHSE